MMEGQRGETVYSQGLHYFHLSIAQGRGTRKGGLRSR